jgi:hypothetical protein
LKEWKSHQAPVRIDFVNPGEHGHIFLGHASRGHLHRVARTYGGDLAVDSGEQGKTGQANELEEETHGSVGNGYRHCEFE